ncbi:hypothetical protein BR93DRAFT_947014 [Coniochaeta sp. PMI_546]|nr:hypothetical protein BR93DRAFT_947014 [Coniochaeta sp. PMI_546]
MPPFRSVNPPQGPDDQSPDDMSSTSPPVPESNDAPPQPQSQSQPQPPPQPQPPNPSADDAITPTRANFATSGMAAQRPLPTSPFQDITHIIEVSLPKTPKRNDSQRSRKSRDSVDMDMDGSEGEHSGSPGDSGNDSGTVTNKKKKTQRFFCTEFPPCKLSFTRSEHLARHIRKHTGERPFMCHCNRRFSRLDNLRQHAQTVHQNEEIPIDSPAAMGTRFQKQVRTDKMRQVAGGRSRAGTAGSVGSTGRGHQKSLSTSIIGSIGSNFTANEGRPRPPALALPSDPRARYSHESLPVVPDGYMRGPPSPTGYHTPTSASFSTGTNSPGWGSGGPSPMPSHSRSHSMYNTYADRIPGRRLSQPSSSHPFMPMSPSRQFAPERNPPYSPSGDGSLLSSPTTPTSSWSRRESISSVADDAYRRRTWHPDTRDYAGASRLNQVISTSQLNELPVPPPLADPDRRQQPQQQPQRLPGIESFDNPQPPSTILGRPPSPMMIDSGPDIPRRPGHSLLPGWTMIEDASLDPGLNSGLTRLDINQPPRDSATAWANEASQAVLAQADQVRRSHVPPAGRFEPEPVMSNAPINTTSDLPRDLPSRDKRRAWFNGPLPMHYGHATIHEGRAQGERTTRPDIVHPNMNEFRGFPTRNDGPVLHQIPRVPPAERGSTEAGYRGGSFYEERPGVIHVEVSHQERRRQEQPNRDDLRALDALVAVATNEATTATERQKLQDRGRSAGLNGWNTPTNPKGLYNVRRWEHREGEEEEDKHDPPRDSDW